MKEKCELYLNGNKINFCFKYNFKKKGKYTIKIILKKNLECSNYMFSNCSSLTSLNLSNFNTNNVTNMDSMFYYCSSLTSLNLSNFNTNNVTDMAVMFYESEKLNKNGIITKDKKILVQLNDDLNYS